MNNVLRPKHVHSQPHGLLTCYSLAKVAGVAPRTIEKWCDKGHIEHRRVPDSLHRRITIPEAIQFLVKHGFRREALALMNYVKPAVTMVEVPAELAHQLSTRWLLPYSVTPRIYQNAITAASELGKHVPAVVIVSAFVGESTLRQLYTVAKLASAEYGMSLRYVVLVGDEATPIGEGEQYTFFQVNASPQLLIELISSSLPLRTEG